jgi:hypothetical protein
VIASTDSVLAKLLYGWQADWPTLSLSAPKERAGPAEATVEGKRSGRRRRQWNGISDDWPSAFTSAGGSGKGVRELEGRKSCKERMTAAKPRPARGAAGCGHQQGGPLR